MQSQIVVPLDGSPLAETILPQAQVLARAARRGLTLVYALPPPQVTGALTTGMIPTTSLYESWEQALVWARRYLTDQVNHLAAEDLRVRAEVIDGDPVPAILAYAAAHPEVAALAMATHGRTGLRRWVFGSVADAVLHAARVPLLMLRPPAARPDIPLRAARPYRTILVPLDGSTVAEAALPPAQELARATGATLVLVASVLEPELALVAVGGLPDVLAPSGNGVAPSWMAAAEQAAAPDLERYLTGMAQRLEANGYPVEKRLTYGPAAPAILHLSEEVDADLIVMSTHGRGGLERLLLGSVAMQVLQAARRPILLVREGHAGAPEQAG